MHDSGQRSSMMSELRLLALAAAEAAGEDEADEPLVEVDDDVAFVEVATLVEVDQARQAQVFSSMLREAVGR